MTSKNHVHKLRRHKYPSGYTVYFCTLPDCTYRAEVKFLLGKKSVCWRCGRDFLMNEYSIRLAKPHCDDCSKTKVTPEITNTLHEIEKKVARSSADDLRERLKNSIKHALETANDTSSSPTKTTRIVSIPDTDDIL